MMHFPLIVVLFIFIVGSWSSEHER